MSFRFRVRAFEVSEKTFEVESLGETALENTQGPFLKALIVMMNVVNIVMMMLRMRMMARKFRTCSLLIA